MAITFVGEAQNTNLDTSLVATLPTGVQLGDFLLLVLNLDDGTRNITSGLEGYTALGALIDDSVAASIDSEAFYKIAGSSESAPTIIVENPEAKNQRVVVSAWRGVDQGNPLDVAQVINQQAGTSVSAGSLTTVTDNAVLVRLCVHDDTGDGPPATNDGAATVFMPNMAGGGGNGAGHYREISPAGSTGSASYTIAAFESMGVISLALRAAIVPVTPTLRKSSTFEVETTLTTLASATLNANAITVNSLTGTTANLTDSDGTITTSGLYDLVLTDDVAATETIEVQVNVVGLPSNKVRKDGGILASLTDLEFRASNAGGTSVKQLSALTTDASGDTAITDLSDLSEAVGDPLTISMYSPSADVGITFVQALELI